MNSVDESGCVEQVDVESHQLGASGVGDAGPGEITLTNVLPNEILLSIFRFLKYNDLINAEQVCNRWKTVVETCFAAEKQLTVILDITDYYSDLKRMERYGSSIQKLKFVLDSICTNDLFDVDWAETIADRFPKLLTVEFEKIHITTDSFTCLSRKCSELENVSFSFCSFTDGGLRLFLQALPGIKVLKMKYCDGPRDLEPQPSTVFSTCRNLQTFIMCGTSFRCSDTASFSRFCKECVTLRTLHILLSDMPKEMFAQIENCSLLEELRLDDSQYVDDSALITISKGCPNLRAVSFSKLPLVSDRGLICFVRCKNLYSFDWTDNKLTDEALVELSKCVNLREVKVENCQPVSDRGCAALLAHCPQLQLLDVKYCKGVSNATVDSAIQAAECRCSGLVLELRLFGTSVTPQIYENCHRSLLYLNYEFHTSIRN